jgi:hypothetical protein
MKTIDLGESKKFEIKLGGSVHVLREPSVSDISTHKDGILSGDVDTFLVFLQDLGMPKKAANSLSVSQLATLTEGLLGDLNEKK